MNELKPKLFDVLKDYSKEQAMRDVISGIIVAIIALPLSIALAIASGVGPEQGLYTAIIAGFFISFFGGSRVQIGGPTAAFVVIIYGIVADYGTAGLTVATILAGIFLIVMGICHFGSLIKYIPYTITTGFTCGIAVTLFVGQLKDFFGLSIASVPSGFVDKVIAYATNISTINWTATAVGAAAIVIMLLWPKVTDKIPGSLIAIIITTAVVYFAKLPVNTIGSVYGELSSSFPTPHVPALSMKLVQEMLSPAFTIALLAGIESLLSAVVSDGMIGDTHKSNAELIGQGLGNIFSGIFGGIPATGAIAVPQPRPQRRPHPDRRHRALYHLNHYPSGAHAACRFDPDDNTCRCSSDRGCQHGGLDFLFPPLQNSAKERCHCAGGNLPAHRIFRSRDRD